MKKNKRIVWSLIIILNMLFCWNTTAFADGLGGTGGTGEGNIGGTNVYTFSYMYDAKTDAIQLHVKTKRAISSFGNKDYYIYTSPSDQLKLHTKNPVLGNSIENAITSMNAIGGYNLSIADVKAALNKLGYYDKGNGIWKYNGGYLTYVSAVKIRPQIHTIQYDANGGSGAPGNQTKVQGKELFVSQQKPSRTGYVFEHWNASIGGNYSAGQAYTYDQNGGVVTMKANWTDKSAPDCSTFVATPTKWSGGNGKVTFNVRDQGSGLSKITLQRYSYVTRSWHTVKIWSYNGDTSSVSNSYTETAEGVFYYKLTVVDKAGNTTTKTSETIYLDHSNPVLLGMNETVTAWTNVAPIINVKSTDYLQGTTYAGSGVVSVVIKDDSGHVVANGSNTARYTLEAKYEGIHTWTIVATDHVGHMSSSLITTKYDITKPRVDGTETTHVTADGEIVSGYCQDNIINQNVDDKVERSEHNPNVTSGLKSVLLYRVKNGAKTIINSPETKAIFGSSNTNSSFHMYYDANLQEEYEEYYQIVATDFAGNVTIKKLINQKSLLVWFHTSIDRSTYE